MTFDYTDLTVLSDALDDVRKVRIAMRNREDSGREVKHGNVHLIVGMIGDTIEEAEEGLEHQLRESLKDCPMYGWVKKNAGIGELSAARLLGLIGDPLTYVDGEGNTWDRSVSSLWHYAGYAPGFDKRRRGEQCSYNPRVRTVMHLINEACLKAKSSPFRDVYYERKDHTEGRQHAEVCMNSVRPCAGKPRGSNGCGTRANPELGEVGSLWRDGHRHQDAMRVMGKEILKDMWIFAQA